MGMKWGTATVVMCGLTALAGTSDPEKPVADFAAQRAESIRLMRESIARQRESVRGQAPRMASVPDRGPAPAMAPQIECDPVAEGDLASMIARAATESRLDPDLLRAVIHQESAFRPCAVSVRGAMGLMQLMPETAADLGLSDPFDPRRNIQSGAQYLRQMLDQFEGDEQMALAAYNAGPARVQGRPFAEIPEVREYVERILKEWKDARKPAEPAK